MKKTIYIPYDTEELDDSVEVVVDMSDLRFEVPDDRKKLYGFIFLRNTSLDAELSFDNCSFEDKEEYLNLFLTTKVTLKSKLLSSTWIEILGYDGEGIYLQSILSLDEIKLFIDRNHEFIDHIRQFINSLPLYAMFCFHRPNERPMDLSEFDTNHYDGISMANFYQLSQFDAFPLLLEPAPSENRKPVFFESIFRNTKNQYNLMLTMRNLPYVNLLMAMFSSPDEQAEFVAKLNDLLKTE